MFRVRNVCWPLVNSLQGHAVSIPNSFPTPPPRPIVADHSRKKLDVEQVRLKRSKERSDAVENLQRHTVSGLRHICDLLGASESEDDAHVAEMVRADQTLIRVVASFLREPDQGGVPEIPSNG